MNERGIAGAVLCGGRSTRMGRDKAFVSVDGMPMARRVATTLTAAGCSPVIAVGGDAAGLATLGLATVADRWPGEGPVGGVLTALEACVDADVVVVMACDTPWLDAATVVALLAALATQPHSVAAVAHTDRVEPLCAAWRRSSLPELATAFDAGERRLHRVLAAMSVATLQVAPNVLRNVNTPTDVPG